MFATYTAWLTRNLYAADPDIYSKAPVSSTTPAPDASYDPDRLHKLSTNLKKYEDNFSHHLRILLDALNYYAATETVVLLGLCARLSTASEGAGEAFSGGVGGADGFAGEH
jgi:gamma-tubulin complex component 2